MRRYDDPVDVRRGQVAGAGGAAVLVEGPAQFLWRGRLWRVTAVVAHWVETGAWWQSSGVHAVLGADELEAGRSGSTSGSPAGSTSGSTVGTDLAAEREVWRVEADRGMASVRDVGEDRPGRGVFDLVFDWAEGAWRLSRCLD